MIRHPRNDFKHFFMLLTVVVLFYNCFLLTACSDSANSASVALPEEAAASVYSSTVPENSQAVMLPLYDPFQDISVSFSGYDTRGSLSLHYIGNETGLQFTADKTENLSNGEEVIVRLENPQEAVQNGWEAAKREAVYTVQNLIPLTDYDPFNYVSVVLEGTQPFGELKARYRGPLPLQLRQDHFSGLKNGDSVLLEMELQESFDPASEGFQLSGTSRLYLIQGLFLMPEKPQDFSRESIRQLSDLAKESYLKTMKADPEQPDHPVRMGTDEVFLIRHDDRHNSVILTFKLCGEEENSVSWYSYVWFDDITVKPDGRMYSQPEACKVPDSLCRFGHIHGEGFEKNGCCYTGFESREKLLEGLAARLREGEKLVAESGEVPVSPQPVEKTKATLLTVGDMLLHDSLFPQIRQPDGTYHYDFIFENMKDVFAGHDLVIANNEAIIGGNEYGMRGYPGFNARTEFGDAEIRAGINVVLHSNNHARDMNLSGIRNCLTYWKENHPEMTVLGMHESAEAAADITILEINGIRIAMFNYTYGLNGLVIPDDQSYLVDRMDETTWDKIGAELRRAEEMADFTVVFPHWGTEYMLQPNYSQIRWAKWFIENGADLIIGNHPHCPQPVEWITARNGNQGLCYYSLGNFISNQARTISTIGEIALVEICKEGEDCYISDCDVDFEITWFTPSLTGHKAVPLVMFTEEMAKTHAAVTDLKEGEINNNLAYPMNLETIYRLTDGIRNHLAEQRDGRVK